MNLGNDTLPSGTLLFADTLEVGQVLGRGGFGIVYEAFHFEHQKRLAIKELFPQGLASRGQNNQVQVSSQTEMQAAIARTSREAAMLRLLKHPSATKLFAYWEENGTAYMALELLQGQTLESRIERGQLLNAEEAKQALLTILEVLEELHSHGFLHRDIKPANIMFTPTRVELIDFGSLTEFKKGERTKVTSRIATPEYAPLEQFGSEVTLSPATDLYALAATFCEAMTGSRVPSALERANGASIESNMVAVQRVSSDLADVLEKALEARIDLRYLTAAAMRLDLLITNPNQTTTPQIPVSSKKGINWFWILTRATPVAIALSLLVIQLIIPDGLIRKTVAYMLAPTLDEFLVSGGFTYSNNSNDPNFIESFDFAPIGKDYYLSLGDAAISKDKSILFVQMMIYLKNLKKSFLLINVYQINTRKLLNSTRIDDFPKGFRGGFSDFRLPDGDLFIYFKYGKFLLKYNQFGDLINKSKYNFYIGDDFRIEKDYIYIYGYNSEFEYGYLNHFLILDKNNLNTIFQKFFPDNQQVKSAIFNEKLVSFIRFNENCFIETFTNNEKIYSIRKIENNFCFNYTKQISEDLILNFNYATKKSVEFYEIKNRNNFVFKKSFFLDSPYETNLYKINNGFVLANSKSYLFDKSLNFKQIRGDISNSNTYFLLDDSILEISRFSISRYRL